MHILAILLGIIGTAIFWAVRLSNNRKNISDAANMARGAAVRAKNLPRQRRFKKAYHRQGLDLIETPHEAATVLMLMIARESESRRLSDAERQMIETLLKTEMQLSNDEADGLILQMDNLTHDLNLPESAISPMVKILREQIDRETAAELADMLDTIATCDGAPTIAQMDFVRRFKEPFDLN